MHPAETAGAADNRSKNFYGPAAEVCCSQINGIWFGKNNLISCKGESDNKFTALVRPGIHIHLSPVVFGDDKIGDGQT